MSVPMKRWLTMKWTELQGHVDEKVAVLPIGSVEQHGPHLPLGTDSLIPVGLADRLAASAPNLADRLIMMPPVYHTYAKHSDFWPGTLNLDGDTLISFVRDVCQNTFRQGITRVMALNGHMESVQFILEGARKALEVYPEARFFLINWWDLVPDDLIDDLFGDRWPGWEMEHAALTESSLMMALYPDLVLQSDLPSDRPPEHLPFTVLPEPPSVRPRSGSYADSRGASAEIGERLVAEITAGILRALQDHILVMEAPSGGGDDT